MSDYQPTTEQAREAWRQYHVSQFGFPSVDESGAAEAGFDAWLADVTRSRQSYKPSDEQVAELRMAYQYAGFGRGHTARGLLAEALPDVFTDEFLEAADV